MGGRTAPLDEPDAGAVASGHAAEVSLSPGEAETPLRPTSADPSTAVPVWEELDDASIPPRRTEPAMAYDSARGKVVLFGGADSHLRGDTWEWDGVSWRRVATTGPSARDGHAMAYDATRKKVVLFGGYAGSDGRLGDTWEWDGVRWTRVATTGPSPRNDSAMAYDAKRERVVLFGGLASSRLGDTWEWDGESWTKTAETGPSARTTHIVYDAKREVTLLFGG